MLPVFFPMLSLLVGPVLPQSPVPQYPHSPILVPNANPGALDQESIELLRMIERKYAAIKSISCTVDTGHMGPSLKPTIMGHGRLIFKRPDKMFVQTGAGSVIDSAHIYGDHYYVSSAGTPGEFTAIPYSYSINSIEDSQTPLRAGPGFWNIESLLAGHGLMDRYHWAAIASIRKSNEKLTDGTEVVTVSVTLGYDQPSASDTTSYSIGLKDHLIHAIVRGEGPSVSYNVAQYGRVKANPKISDTAFELPKAAHILPLCTVETIHDYTVDLDKGGKDGVAVGDRLLVCMPPGYYSNGEVAVVAVEAHSCEATILNNTAGIRPGELCFIVSHHLLTRSSRRHKTGNYTAFINAASSAPPSPIGTHYWPAGGCRSSTFIYFRVNLPRRTLSGSPSKRLPPIT